MAIKLSIRFGMVVLPVDVDAAARPDRVSMRQMAPDGYGVKQKLVSEKTGVEVHRSELRKGFDSRDGLLVEIPAAEIAALEPLTSKTIDVLEFVDGATIDPIHYESSYYMSPSAGGDKAYALLYATLKNKNVQAIAKAFMHGSEHVVSIRASRGGLILSKLFYDNEVRREREYRCDVSTLPETELAMASMLVTHMSTPSFDSSKFVDEYSSKLRELILRKVAGVNPCPLPAAPSPDLMETMRKSLEALGKTPMVEHEEVVMAAAPSGPRTPRKRKRVDVTALPPPPTPPTPPAENSLIDQIMEDYELQNSAV